MKAKGFQVADLSGHEYDPYFMKDTIHIAWKGWVYVDKAMEQFYKTKQGDGSLSTVMTEYVKRTRRGHSLPCFLCDLIFSQI
ncbi:D-alanyl-lipoteichoic acid biosynthesis protein DltD [Bacillus velezensis]